jgi:hypothetical protein
MQITLFQRYFPVKDSPTAVSLLPYPASQKHTYPLGGKIYDAKFREIKITVPAESTIDQLKNMLCWRSPKGLMKSTATEVFNFAHARTSGFRLTA